MNQIYIAGIGMTHFGRHLDRSVKDLTRAAVDEALADAGCESGDLQAAFFANAVQGHLEGQNSIRGQIALRAMGIGDIPIVNVENACASASTALSLATQFLKAGEGDIALAVGVEKMFSTDKAKMFSAFDGGWDVTTVESNKASLLELGQGVAVPPGTTSDKPYSMFMDIYAAFCRFHMRKFGTTQRQIAAVAAKNHRHSVHNPLAQYRNAYTVDEVLAAPPITYPLTLPMCSPISDGAAAAIVCTERGLVKLRVARERAIRLLASVVLTGSERASEDVARHLTVIAARKAYERAGIGPDDISVAEVHDATAMGEIIQVENLGLCSIGEGGPCAERGDTTIGGRVPVNPSGGLESKGHPVGATGLAQIYELVTQLRGEANGRQVEGARFAIAENGGGLLGIEEAVACVTILGR
jgi:acetyl-CoA acyltransferase